MSTGEPWGAGIKLTPNWDLEVDKTGDIAGVAGIDEIEKDLSFRTAIELDKEVGGIIDKNTLAEMRIVVRQSLNNDERVNRVVDVSSETLSSPGKDDTVRIRATVISDDDQEYDLTGDFEV